MPSPYAVRFQVASTTQALWPAPAPPPPSGKPPSSTTTLSVTLNVIDPAYSSRAPTGPIPSSITVQLGTDPATIADFALGNIFDITFTLVDPAASLLPAPAFSTP